VEILTKAGMRLWTEEQAKMDKIFFPKLPYYMRPTTRAGRNKQLEPGSPRPTSKMEQTPKSEIKTLQKR
jgi:hypothetical protein